MHHAARANMREEPNNIKFSTYSETNFAHPQTNQPAASADDFTVYSLLFLTNRKFGKRQHPIHL